MGQVIGLTPEQIGSAVSLGYDERKMQMAETALPTELGYRQALTQQALAQPGLSARNIAAEEQRNANQMSIATMQNELGKQEMEIRSRLADANIGLDNAQKNALVQQLSAINTLKSYNLTGDMKQDIPIIAAVYPAALGQYIAGQQARGGASAAKIQLANFIAQVKFAGQPDGLQKALDIVLNQPFEQVRLNFIADLQMDPSMRGKRMLDAIKQFNELAGMSQMNEEATTAPKQGEQVYIYDHPGAKFNLQK